MYRTFKKAGLLVGILAVAVTIQGCDIAAIMSAAGGILAGLGRAFGGPTGQLLGQLGQTLGGVGQAFGQQQAGVAGQLAGAAGQLGGPLVNGLPNPQQIGQQIGQIGQIGQQVGGILNPGQGPLNPGQTPGTGTLTLPTPPGTDLVAAAIARLPRGVPLSPQQIQAAAASVTPNPQQAIQIAQAIQQQIQQAGGQPLPIPNGVTPILPNGSGAPQGIPVQIAGANQQFQGALAATTGILGLINLFRGNNQGPVQPPVVQPQPLPANNQPPATNIVTVTRAA